MKKLQFDYIQLICIVLSKQGNEFFDFDKTKFSSAQLHLSKSLRNVKTFFCTIFYKTELAETVWFL